MIIITAVDKNDGDKLELIWETKLPKWIYYIHPANSHGRLQYEHVVILPPRARRMIKGPCFYSYYFTITTILNYYVVCTKY